MLEYSTPVRTRGAEEEEREGQSKALAEATRYYRRQKLMMSRVTRGSPKAHS
jgi:hypothetical protein